MDNNQIKSNSSDEYEEIEEEIEEEEEIEDNEEIEKETREKEVDSNLYFDNCKKYIL